MSTDVTSLLEEFATQVQSGEYSAASDTADQIAEGYERKSANETVLREQATAVAGTDSNSQSETLREFLTEGFRVEMVRSAFLMSASGLQANPTGVDSEAVADHAAQAQEAEDTFTEQLQTASKVLAQADIPGKHAILSAEADRDLIPKGETITVTATVGNVGDEPVTGVSTKLTSSSELTGEETINHGTLSSSAETSVEGQFDATSSGEGSVKVRAVDGEGDTATSEVEVSIIGKRDALDLARDRVADLLSILPQQDGKRKGRTTAVRKRARNLRHSLDRATSALETGNGRQVKGQLDASEQQATALKADLSQNNGHSEKNGTGGNGKDGSGHSLSPTVREQATVQLTSIVELIRLARRAET